MVMTKRLGNRALVVLAVLLCPVIAGAIIYYSLRRTHTDIAHFGNWMSFGVFFLLWPLATRAGLMHFDGRTVPIFITCAGIVLAMVAVSTIRRTDAPIAGPR
jgi:hypothetical protein